MSKGSKKGNIGINPKDIWTRIDLRKGKWDWEDVLNVKVRTWCLTWEIIQQGMWTC